MSSHPDVTPSDERVAALFGVGGPLQGFAASEMGRLLVTYCRDLLAWRDGEAAASARVTGWSRARDLGALFEAVRDDLPREPVAPDLPSSPRLRRLGTKAAIREAAARFESDVADEVGRAGDADLAIYEWLGEPRALVELTPDQFGGWALYRVRGVGEEPLPGAACEAIAQALATLGVGHGPETTRLRLQLDRATDVLWRYHHLTAFGIEGGEAPGLTAPDPAPLFRAGGALHRLADDLTTDAQQLVAACQAALVRGLGEASAGERVAAWGRAEHVAELLRRIADDLIAEPAAPDLPASARLRRLGSKAAIREAAARLESLAADFIADFAGDRRAMFEWLDAPGALVELERDQLVGWRLDSARLADDQHVPEPMAAEITDELRRMGVYVGPGYQQLRTALREIQERPAYDYRFWYVFGSEVSPYGDD